MKTFCKFCFQAVHSLILTCILFLGCVSSGPRYDLPQAEHLGYQQVAERVLASKIPLSALNQQGPFLVEAVRDFSITLGPRRSVDTDLFLSAHDGFAPLIVFMHGNKYNKQVHRGQARHLASWGFHCLVLELPNQSQWLANGAVIAELLRLLQAYPEILHRDVKVPQVILVGHSFGGSAVSFAASEFPQILGLILLDPALVHSDLVKKFRQIKVPAVVIAADKEVFHSRQRPAFFNNLAGPKITVEVKGATHNDAQLPSIGKVRWGMDFATTAVYQRRFLHSIVATAFSLAAQDQLQFAWKALLEGAKQGYLDNGRASL